METITAGNFIIYPLNESAVTIEFGNIIDETLLRRIGDFNRLLCQDPFPGMYDAVPAYSTLTVFFDPMIVIGAKELTGNSCFEKVSGYLKKIKEEESPSLSANAEIISIPVCYGGSFGPDLEFLAGYHILPLEEVIKLHSSAIYTVYMIGFIPGFAYMGGLDERLETPRKPVPQKVPAGAVGIAGKQTGIYPLETPGGWQIIGQTPVKLFDPSRQHPALLKAGDKVKFEPISSTTFKKY